MPTVDHLGWPIRVLRRQGTTSASRKPCRKNMKLIKITCIKITWILLILPSETLAFHFVFAAPNSSEFTGGHVCCWINSRRSRNGNTSLLVRQKRRSMQFSTASLLSQSHQFPSKHEQPQRKNLLVSMKEIRNRKVVAESNLNRKHYVVPILTTVLLSMAIHWFQFGSPSTVQLSGASIARTDESTSTTLLVAAERSDLDDSSLLDAFGSQLTTQSSVIQAKGNSQLNGLQLQPSAVPSAVPSPPSPATEERSEGSDFSNALQEMQRRKRIDPRTHG